MPHFVWSSEYELGISVIDSQHRRIIDYINQVYATMEREQNPKVINRILTDLVDYTFSHLAFEEAMLEEIGYSEYHAHKLTHRTFGKLIDNLRQRAEQGEAVGVELAAFLNNWLISHIMVEDAQYVDAVKVHLAGQEAGRRRLWLHRAVGKYFQ